MAGGPCRVKTRRQFLAAFAALLATPSPDEFYVKVLRIDRDREEIEVELATPPKQTKVLFHGEVGQVSAGDYVKLKVRGVDWKFGGKPMKVGSVTWVF